MEKETRDLLYESKECAPYLIDYSTIGHIKKGYSPTKKEVEQEAKDFYDEQFPIN